MLISAGTAMLVVLIVPDLTAQAMKNIPLAQPPCHCPIWWREKSAVRRLCKPQAGLSSEPFVTRGLVPHTAGAATELI